MAEVQEQIQEKLSEAQEKISGTSGATALKAAAAAGAATAATYAVRRALSHDSGSSNGASEVVNTLKKKRSRSSSILASAAETSWEAASDALLPLADDAAEAAGKYLATHGPEILRERVIPKFIQAFNDAK
jgi:hypothetical protein